MIRPARASERCELEALQRRASLANQEHRAALLAHPDAIALPAAHLAGTLVAERNGTVLGFAVVQPRSDGDAELDGLFVEPAMWRQGVGAALVEAAVLTVRGEALHVVADPAAGAFYLASGFEATSVAATRFGPALAMTRWLDDGED